MKSIKKIKKEIKILMKKIFLTLLAIICVLLLAAGGFIIATLFTDGVYSVYLDTAPEEEYNLNAFNAYLKTVFYSEDGISVRFEGKEKADKLVSVLKAEEVGSETFSGITVKSYRSPLIRRTRKTAFGEVNLQIAVKQDGTVTAGTPLLLGSY